MSKCEVVISSKIYDWYFIGIVVDWHEYFFVWGNGPRENTKYCEIFFHHILVIAIRVHFWCLLDEQTLNGHLHDIFEFLFNTHQRFSTAIFFLLRRQQFFFSFFTFAQQINLYFQVNGASTGFFILIWSTESSIPQSSIQSSLPFWTEVLVFGPFLWPN